MRWEVPLVDLKAQYESVKDEIDRAIQEVLNSTDFILGPAVRKFEEAFARFLGANHVVGTSSGTSALMLAMKALGIGEGDEVITTAMTFTATAEAICHVGAKPVFVDIDPRTFGMDASKIEARITPRTKALVPVHLYGNPCEMDAILNLARENDLKVIEDAAQAHGATYKGRVIGTLGHAACFSFYPGKNLGAYGDAGAVATSDEDLARRIRLLSNHGRTSKYEHMEVGYGERMDTLQAAVLLAKLPHLPEWTHLRRKWSNEYILNMAELGVETVAQTEGAESAFHIFAVQVDQRDGLLGKMAGAGIQAGVHYPVPLHLQPAYRFLGYREGDFPFSEHAAATELSLPIYPELGETGVRKVADALRKAQGELIRK